MTEITEKDILNDIIKVINFYYENEKNDEIIDIHKIKNINKISDNIFVSINKLNNNYFRENENIFILKKYEEIINKYNYNLNNSNNFSVEIEEFKYLLQNKLNNICDHEWVLDSIDITPDISKNICYCDICKITKI